MRKNMTNEKEFLDAKEIAMKKLEKACVKDEVDEDILNLLSIINGSQDYYTSSSCAGRIVLLEIPSIGDKKEAVFLGKWHREIDSSELISAAKKSEKGMTWLLAQAPILHLGAKTISAADELLKTAISCGFKDSGLKSLGKKIIIEVCSTERLDAPVGKDGILFCNDNHLQLLVNISNEVIRKSSVKLKKFEEKLRKDLSTYKTTN
jgi:tRNA wybutosine-synthesizing protein 3